MVDLTRAEFALPVCRVVIPGLEDGDETKLPGEIDAQRAREIMEAIRERLAKPASPLIEKKYLERLLDAE